jgi:AraC-like DNA-binding protein
MTPNQTLPSPPPEVTPRRLRLETIADWEPLVIESGYSVKNLAARCGYSVRSLQRFVSSKFNRGLLEFIADLRLRRARTLLREGLSVKETAAELGYKQPSHFCRCFKEYHRMTPSEVIRYSGCAEVDDVESGQLSLNVPLEPARKRSQKP